MPYPEIFIPPSPVTPAIRRTVSIPASPPSTAGRTRVALWRAHRAPRSPSRGWAASSGPTSRTPTRAIPLMSPVRARRRFPPRFLSLPASHCLHPSAAPLLLRGARPLGACAEKFRIAQWARQFLVDRYGDNLGQIEARISPSPSPCPAPSAFVCHASPCADGLRSPDLVLLRPPLGRAGVRSPDPAVVPSLHSELPGLPERLAPASRPRHDAE